MNKIIINGSYRDGHTQKMIDYLCEKEDFKVINCAQLNVAACVNCGYCQHEFNQCIIEDEMNMIYKLVENAEILIYASPIYTASITPCLLSVASRFQKYFEVRHTFKKPYPLKRKKGFVLLSGGSNLAMYYQNALNICQTSFLELNAEYVGCALFKETDKFNYLNEETKASLDLMLKEMRN